LAAEEVDVVHLTPDLCAQGFRLYKSHQDKAWGLVDCISFMVMREAGLNQALTFDQHFVQAGFQALMLETPHP
jgi:predicted nucleic acid-binding protein